MATDFTIPKNVGTGCVKRDYSQKLVGSAGIPFPREGLIPRSDWQKWFDYRKKNRTRYSDMRKRISFPVYDQGRTSMCWAHSVAMQITLTMMMQGQEYVELSPTAIALKIKNFADQGGNCGDAMSYAAEVGIPTVNEWPQRSTQRHFDNDQTWQVAKKYRVKEWYDLEPGNTDQIVSCLLRGIPLAADCGFWQHSICLADIESLFPLAYRFPNSWGNNWGENGEGVVEDSKGVGDWGLAAAASVEAM